VLHSWKPIWKVTWLIPGVYLRRSSRRRRNLQQSPRQYNMSNIIDSEAGSELFGSYEAELKLVQADLNQKLDQIPELEGEPRKAAIGQAERAVEEAKEIVSLSCMSRTPSESGANNILTHFANSWTRCASRNRTFHRPASPKSTHASATTRPISTR
jgi:hypothetical protein